MYQSAIDDVISQNQFLVEDRIQLFLKQLAQGVQSREYKGAVHLLLFIFKVLHRPRK